jgi:hypothetical protein
MPAPESLAREIPCTFTRAACPVPGIARRRLRKNLSALLYLLLGLGGFCGLQTKAAAALVTGAGHGADARAAIAAVLGVPARDILVRDRPQ